MFCKKCGEAIDVDANFCAKCGTPVNRSSTASVTSTSKKQDEEIEKDETFVGKGVKFFTGMFNKHSTKEEVADSELRILLVGHTGHGKSATGNSLLGKDVFKHARTHASVTKTSHREVGIRFATKLDIIDTPGFFDTSHDDTFVHDELSKCVALTIPGFNAIFFILRPERFSEEIVKTVEIFFDFFGKTVDDYAFLILTFTKNKEQKEEYLAAENEQHAKLVELVKRCKNKVLFIDNDAKPKITKDLLVQQIIKEVKEANGKLKQPYFSNDVTKKVEEHAISYNKKHGFGKVSEKTQKDGKNPTGQYQETASLTESLKKTSVDEGQVTSIQESTTASLVPALDPVSVPESTTVAKTSIKTPTAVSVTPPTYQAPISKAEEFKVPTDSISVVSTAAVTPTVVNVNSMDSSGNLATEKIERKLESSKQVINITVQCEPKSSNSAAQYEEYKKAVETDKEVQKTLTDIVVDAAGSAIRYAANKVVSFWKSLW